MPSLAERRDPEARHIDLRYHMKSTGVEPDLIELIDEISLAAKYIVNSVQTGDLGIAGTSNIYGEEQLALDVLSDRIIRRRLENSGLVKNIASEEQGEIIACYRPETGRYSVAYDPLDGSSLVDVNLAIGTIVSIHEGDNLLEPGSKQAAALYIQYGPRTTLVYTAGHGVHEFAMNHLGEFIMAAEDIKMKPKARIYSPGGLRKDYTPAHEQFINHLEHTGVKLRYSGGLVPDINQILIKGDGIFMYPALKNAPEGKLRLLFELKPMAFLVENAGGKASTGRGNLLDVVPTKLDQRAPIYIGCKEDVEKAEEFLRNEE
jgi:fructose-1,6-bisphosphatase I